MFKEGDDSVLRGCYGEIWVLTCEIKGGEIGETLGDVEGSVAGVRVDWIGSDETMWIDPDIGLEEGLETIGDRKSLR